MIPALEVRGLTTRFATRKGYVTAVNNVSFSVAPGRIMGLVGESGSGKSVTAFSIMGLIDAPGEISAGSVRIEGEDMRQMTPEAQRKMRGRRVSMVFQDPMMTLNPVLRVGDQMAMAVQVHDRVSKKAAWERARDALDIVGIPAPTERLQAYPHQLSGGMRQRVAIATALLHRPAVILADEPTTALDVSIQGQILAEVRRLADDTGTAIVWVTHDLAVVSSLADDICVMYAGCIVERGTADQVINHPCHPYTHGLIQSVPSLHEPGRKLPQIPGSTPQLSQLPSGCAFRNRCAHATDLCRTDPPDAARGERRVLCHHPLEEEA
ncbi:peptide ABC transporter substrate-binding protein [Puniceibacterium antarcticum]|uniref:Peptide ABC transporter substrate-binding protein n=1 Tax=Puniceibacterium antarcticum TaxID=1206336 RepID=A0A2G8RHR7_9RHOB|nr:ABC transporter ATP-binding protein [Puniceibacterium antarcticum]PIL21033.1 peptide ABC transporter substrate-binding protein [Puniceibacterium antarcticum]